MMFFYFANIWFENPYDIIDIIRYYLEIYLESQSS